MAAAGAAPALDVAQFDQVLELPALRVPARRVGELQKDADLKALLYRRRGIRNILAMDSGPGDTLRLLLLQPGTGREALPPAATALLEAGVAQLVSHELRLGYEHFTAEEALQRVLPEGVEVPRGFETVGHLAHFNLRDQQWPHRQAIGQIILDKNPCIKTVVTKVGTLSNEFRTFDMEVIAGRDDTDVTVCERGLKLRFDFRQVYWNSKLSEERVRLLERVAPEDIVCDLFAGVGAFALLCVDKGCRVFANDLNPAGAEAMRQNAILNRFELTVFNLDARECVRTLGRVEALRPSPRPPRVHIVMNLPELALDFLDAFRGMVEAGRSELFSGSAVDLAVHCYCFARDKEQPHAEVHPRLVAALGMVPPGTQIREVRDVAPKKNMYCVEFLVQLQHAEPTMPAVPEAEVEQALPDVPPVAPGRGTSGTAGAAAERRDTEEVPDDQGPEDVKRLKTQ